MSGLTRADQAGQRLIPFAMYAGRNPRKHHGKHPHVWVAAVGYFGSPDIKWRGSKLHADFRDAQAEAEAYFEKEFRP